MPKQVIPTDRLMRPIAHFSHAVRIGNIIHIGATAGTDAGRNLAGTSPGRVDVAAQSRQMLDNVETVLGLLGAGIEDVVRIKTYVVDVRDMQAYGEIFAARYGDVKPSHAVVGAWGFPLPQAAIELDAIAVIGGGQSLAASSLAGAAPATAQAGVRVGDHHYATAFPIDRDGGTVAGDAAAQSDLALNNLLHILSAADLSPSEVCNLHVTLADIRHLAAFDEVFRARFKAPHPSRAVVVAPLQHPDLLVQIEAIAVDGGGSPLGIGKEGEAGATLAGDMLYLGGQLGTGSDIESQTRSAWSRLNACIAEAGFTPDSVLRTNNVLTDWRNYAGFNAGYGANVGEPYPPRATVLGGLSQPGALMQIEAIAHRWGDEATIVQVPGTLGL